VPSKDKFGKRITANASKQAQSDMSASQKSTIERDSTRISTYRFGTLFPAEGGEYKCVINDLSDAGARITLVNSGDTSKFATLKIDGRMTPFSVEIAWRKDDEIGLFFIAE